MTTATGKPEAQDQLNEVLRQVKKIELRTKRLVSSLAAGPYRSAFRGQGMAFEEVREYTPGDDIRQIDWNVTARAGTPFIKVFREERELNLVLLVDVSGSMRFGAIPGISPRAKLALAAEAAGALASNSTTCFRSSRRSKMSRCRSGSGGGRETHRGRPRRCWCGSVFQIA